jgi:hypothetical protein
LHHSEYTREIKKLIGRLAISSLWSPELKEQQLQQTFKQGLGINTQVELVKLGISSVQEVTAHIEAVENILLSEMPTLNEASYRTTNTSRGKRDRNEQNLSKWCEVHRSTSHETNECRAKNAISNRRRDDQYSSNQRSGRSYNNDNDRRHRHNFNTVSQPSFQRNNGRDQRQSSNRNQTKPNTDSRIYAIKEPDHNINRIILSGKTGNSQIQFLIDTGAQTNVIIKDVLHNQTAKTKTIPTTTLELANGSKIDSSEKITLEFTIDDIPGVTFISEFLVITSSSFEAILGMKFLCANEAVIDLKEPRIVLKDHEIELGFPAATQWAKCPDKMICDKTNIFTIQSLKKETKLKIKQLTENIHKE